MREKIEAIVRECVAEESGVDMQKVNSETRILAADGLFDSMGIINFITALEDKVGAALGKSVSLADETVFGKDTPFVNVKSITDYVISKLS